MVELRSNLDWAGEFQTMAERMRLCESEEQMYNALRKFKEQIFSSELKNFAQIVVASIRGDMMNNSIDRQLAIDTAIDAVDNWDGGCNKEREKIIREALEKLPSAQPEQRYTEEELRVFAHGISLSLLSKRSAQHWRYDKDTATEIEFLERLYEKVGADMRGEEV